ALLVRGHGVAESGIVDAGAGVVEGDGAGDVGGALDADEDVQDRKSTRLNSSHVSISYAVFCLKKKHSRAMPSTVKTNQTANYRTPRWKHGIKLPSVRSHTRWNRS